MDYINIGNTIAALRKQIGFTQEELAGLLGITAQAISRWENGHSLPETALLPDLSKFLCSTIDAILMPSTVQAGDILTFGAYKWRVLDVDNSNALIITETTIGKAPYHDFADTVTWEQCNLRKYLNREFFNKFSEPEKAKIIKTKVSDRDNPWYGVKWGKPSFDNVFMLSYDEVVRYFGDSGDLEYKRGKFCTKDGEFVETSEKSMYTKKTHGDAIYDEFNEARQVKNTDGDDDWWWLRSPGGQGSHTAGSIGYLGEIWLCGDDAYRVDGGLRPAMWIKT